MSTPGASTSPIRNDRRTSASPTKSSDGVCWLGIEYHRGLAANRRGYDTVGLDRLPLERYTDK